MRRLIGIAVSAAILWLIWRRIDAHAIMAAVRACDPRWLTAGLLCVVPLTLATAWRFAILSRHAIGIGSATRLILSSSTLNLVLPSKMGDIAKAWVLAGRHGYDPKFALAIVVLEKLLDLASLLLWGVAALIWAGRGDRWMMLAALGVGALLLLITLLIMPIPLGRRLMQACVGLVPGKPGRMIATFLGQWDDVVTWFWSTTQRALGIVALSLAIWAGHLAQFWLFARALDAAVPFLDNMAFATLSILVGLAPFTMAGIGTRDAAILFFYRAWLSPGQGAVLGVLATMRYLMPAIAGLPFLRDYMPKRAGGRSAARGAMSAE